MGMVLDGVFASEQPDSSAEIVDVKGCDISDMQAGRATANWEHLGEKDPGHSANDHVGRVTYAKKIFARGECENTRQREYWDFVRVPFIYGKVELFNDEGHPGAVAVAAMVRHYRNKGLPILVRYSVEGSTLEQDGPVIKKCIARRVALTIKPANKSAISGVISDGDGDEKKVTETTPAEDPLAFLVGTRKHENPDERALGGSPTIACDPELSDTVSAVAELTERLAEVKKSLTAGGMNAAPGALTGGSALQREELHGLHDVGFRNKAKAALRDYDPDTHGEFKKYIKHQLPEASDSFIDRFADAVGDWKVTRQQILAKAERVDVPNGHRSYMRVPAGSGGASCASCRYLSEDGKQCSSKFFQAWNGGSASLPYPADESCSDWYEPKASALEKAEDEVQEPSGRAIRSGGGMSTGSSAFKAKQKKYEKKLAGIKELGAQTALPGMGEGGPATPPAESPEFKVRSGRRLSQGDAYFEHSQGVLHTADGKFKVYIPDLNDRGYGEILHDPELNRIHDTAMRNWMMVHRVLREGKAPPEMVALAALFSAMSPNTAVPVQELAYGHLMDMMGGPTGKGGFEGFDPTKELSRKEYARYAKEFNSIAKGQKLPAWERDHFAHQGSGIWTKEGQRHKIGLGAQKWAGAKNYHEIHKTLVDLVGKHGTDARTIASLLNDMKARAGTKRQGEDPEVKGFAPKTIRYLLGMMGAGNVVVPDTHFIRHTFGLHGADPKSDVLKKYLWNEHNEPLLSELDSYYFNHHPAVSHTRNKLREQYGEELGEQALFPAFWLHWLTIQPHEKRRGWFERGQAKNAETDHAVFWNAVKRVLDKYRIPHGHQLIKSEWQDDGSMAARVAHATKELENQFGYVPATLAMYATMVPAVLSHREPLQKAEKLAEQLRALAKAEPEKPQLVPFGGRAVLPGELEILTGPQKGNKHKLVDVGPKFHHILNDSGHLFRVKADSPYYRINSKPVAQGLGYALVDAQKHGAPGLAQHPDQQELLHGMDLATDAAPRMPGQMRGHSVEQTEGETGWRRSRAGHLSYVKPAFAMDDVVRPSEQAGFSTAHREAAFHQLAKNFFKLGEHVPVTATFYHPVSGQSYSAMKMVEGAEHHEASPTHNAAILSLLHRGVLDKLALMDMILDNRDRHVGNFVLTPGRAPYIHLIDNGLAMLSESSESSEPPRVPMYWDMQEGAPLHPEAVAWAQKLNPLTLGKMMDEMGVPKAAREEAVYRLQAVKNRIARGNVTKGSAFYAPFLSSQGGSGTTTDDIQEAVNSPSESRASLPITSAPGRV